MRIKGKLADEVARIGLLEEEGRITAHRLMLPFQRLRSIEGGEYLWLRCWPTDGFELVEAEYLDEFDYDDDTAGYGPHETWVQYEIEMVGIRDMLGVRGDEVSFLAAHGVAPKPVQLDGIDAAGYVSTLSPEQKSWVLAALERAVSDSDTSELYELWEENGPEDLAAWRAPILSRLASLKTVG